MDKLVLTDDPGARDLAEKLRRLSGRPVAMKFGIDGECVVMGVDGAFVDMPLEVDELGELPSLFGTVHHDVMGTVYTAVQQIKETPRKVPLTRSELLDEFKADRRAVRQLEKWEFIKQRVIALDGVDGGQAKRGARSIYYFTAKGRAYVREHFDPEYGKPVGEPDHQGGAPGSAGGPAGEG